MPRRGFVCLEGRSRETAGISRQHGQGESRVKRQKNQTKDEARPAIAWIAPVLLMIGPNRIKTVEGPEDAIVILQRQWRRASAGPHYRTALTNCQRAVSALRGLEISRESFIAAAIEAGLLCHGRKQQTAAA